MRVEELRSMSEEELIQQHDQMYNRMPDYNIFLNELARRETVRQGERMEAALGFREWNLSTLSPGPNRPIRPELRAISHALATPLDCLLG